LLIRINFKKIFNFAMRYSFLNDSTDYRSYGSGNFSKSQGSGGLFWWSIFIFMLLALATVSWFFSIMVFSYPEKPFHYKLLTKLEKLEPIKKYPLNSVPHGEFVTAGKLLEQYLFFTADKFRVTNDLLKREYIRNFKERSPLYMTGSFAVVGGRPLNGQDVFTNGWVVVARSLEIEDVNIELVLPGLESVEPPYKPGDTIKLDRQKSFANTVHIQKLDENRISATLVSLLYEGVPVANGSVAKLEAPKQLNMEAAWPIARDISLAAGTDNVDKAVQVTTAQASATP
jgi:hypothetical protein